MVTLVCICKIKSLTNKIDTLTLTSDLTHHNPFNKHLIFIKCQTYAWHEGGGEDHEISILVFQDRFKAENPEH